MAATIVIQAHGPGKAGRRPMFSKFEGPASMTTFILTGDTSYPNGGAATNSGYDISSVIGPGKGTMFDKKIIYADCGAFIAPGGAGGLTAGHLVQAVIDIANKRLRIFDNNAEVPNATSLALIVIPFKVIGV